jgi:predicted phage tail protein
MVIAGISEFFMKAPTVSKSNDPPASKYLGINRNTTAVGTPIILAWGTVKLAGHWLSLQADANALVTTSFPTNPT